MFRGAGGSWAYFMDSVKGLLVHNLMQQKNSIVMFQIITFTCGLVGIQV